MIRGGAAQDGSPRRTRGDGRHRFDQARKGRQKNAVDRVVRCVGNFRAMSLALLLTKYSCVPPGLLHAFFIATHGLRRGLHSCAAPRLVFGRLRRLVMIVLQGKETNPKDIAHRTQRCSS